MVNLLTSPLPRLLTSVLPLCMLSICVGFGQQHVQVLPQLTRGDLLAALQRDFTPAGPLDYSTARDTMFLHVWREGGQLEAQYTGYSIPLPVGVDPTEHAFDLGINTEHVYPRSKGTRTGNAEADMHHLYPTRIEVNADRGSLPFADIPDNLTQRWYYLDQQQSLPPSSNRDAYSEGSTFAFEPREERKGDIARAIFYIWSIYRNEAEAADPTFFAAQQNTLCSWHAADPVDAAEFARSEAIARYQGNHNPFVLDCSLPDRLAYCPTRSATCQTLDADELVPEGELLDVWPNPATDHITIAAIRPPEQLVMLDAWGRVVCVLQPSSWQASAQVQHYVLPAHLSPGVYTLLSHDPFAARRIFINGL